VRHVVLALVAAVAVAGCSAGADPEAEVTRGATPSPTSVDGLDGVQFFDDLSTLHTEEPVEYPTVPPVGGPHLPRWLACGVYDEPVPDEAAVHSMEHGAVWITYDPDLPAEDVALLAALTAVDPEYVLVSPYEGLPSPAVATAWGHQLQLDGADDPRLRAFTEAFAGGDQGGEPGAPCREGGITPAEAEGAVGA
jgi:hypothetical protein